MVVINIDTAKDPPEDIKETIKYLQALLRENEPAPQQAAPVAASPPDASAPEAQLPFGMEIFEETQAATPAQPTGQSTTPSTVLPEQKKGDARKSEAERLLEEADEVEVVDEMKGAFIEIVDLDEE
jgi:hypothetical protein